MKIPPKRLSGACPLAGILLLAWPRAADANVPLPAAFGFVAPLWMATLTFGLLLIAVIAMEAVILENGLDLRWRRAVVYSSVANAVSSLYGAIFGAGSCILFALIILAVLVGVELFARLKWNPVLAFGAAVLVGVASLLLMGIITGLVANRTQIGWLIYLSLVPAFLVTVFVEYIVLAHLHRGPLAIRRVALANAASYALLVAILFAARIHPENVPTQSVDWYRMQGVACVHGGRIDKAMAMLEQAHRIQEKQLDYWFRQKEPEFYNAYADEGIARALKSKGQNALARQIVVQALERSNLIDFQREDLERLLQEILADALSSQPLAIGSSGASNQD